MSKTYKTIIEGKSREVRGFDAQKNLVLADGQRYIFERLNFIPPGKRPIEPTGDIFCDPLIEVVKLRRCKNDWKWNDEGKMLSHFLALKYQEFNDPAWWQFRTPEVSRRWVVRLRLDELPPEIQEKVRAVAWFKRYDGLADWGTPILLQSFRPVVSNATGEAVKPTKHKATKVRQSKPVARAGNVVAPTKSAPEFFTNIKAAAAYLGVTTRTILNWKSRGWLQVEQNVKKIRIAKTDLDKCKNQQ